MFVVDLRLKADVRLQKEFVTWADGRIAPQHMSAERAGCMEVEAIAVG